MLHLVTGDVTDYPVFCQQVNRKGVMGAGLARQIRNEYPEVYMQYRHTYQDSSLGSCLYTFTSDNKVCISMFAQDGYGRDRRYTDYNAFKECLKDIRKFLSTSPYTSVAFPYMIGCGLGGGDWYIVLGMIKDFANSIPWDVYIVSRE